MKENKITVELSKLEIKEILSSLACGYNESCMSDENINRDLFKKLQDAIRTNLKNKE